MGSIPTESDNALIGGHEFTKKIRNKEWKHSLEVFKVGVS